MFLIYYKDKVWLIDTMLLTATSKHLYNHATDTSQQRTDIFVPNCQITVKATSALYNNGQLYTTDSYTGPNSVRYMEAPH